MNGMQHTKDHLDVKKEKGSSMPEREPSGELKIQKLDTNRSSFFDGASPAPKQEQYLLHQSQNSGINCDFPESYGNEGILSCKNENDKDSDILVPNSNPGIAQESNPLQVSHVTGDFSKIPKDEPADLHLSQSHNLEVKTSSLCNGQRSTEKLEKVGGTSLPARSVNGMPASQFDEQMLTKTSQPGKVLEKLQPRRNPDAGGCASQPDQVTIKSAHSEKNSVVSNAEPRLDNPETANHALMSKEEKVAYAKKESVSQTLVKASSLSIGVPASQPGRESYTYSTKFEKIEKLQPRRNPDPIVESKSDVGTTPSKTPDKGLDDGYNWRKYGQKLVKGNTFVRSYYRCTHPNCQAKKQVERSHDGFKSDTNYLGNHHHQKPQHSPQVTSTLQVRTPEMPVPSTSKTNAEVTCKLAGLYQHTTNTETSPQSTTGRNADDLSVAVSCSDRSTRDLEDCPDSKRQKRDMGSVDEDVENRSNPDSRQVVQTFSEVDLISDGYRWRKYGQKLVKGNPNPRSYYRCSSVGCLVKKHVERASHDRKLVITTYEGKHVHDIPTSRTVSQSMARGDTDMMSPNDKSSSKSE